MSEVGRTSMSNRFASGQDHNLGPWIIAHATTYWCVPLQFKGKNWKNCPDPFRPVDERYQPARFDSFTAANRAYQRLRLNLHLHSAIIDVTDMTDPLARAVDGLMQNYERKESHRRAEHIRDTVAGQRYRRRNKQLGVKSDPAA